MYFLSLPRRDTCQREWSLNGTVHQDCCCLQITTLKQSTCGPQAAFWLRCSRDTCCSQVSLEEPSVMSKGPSLVFLLLYWVFYRSYSSLETQEHQSSLSGLGLRASSCGCTWQSKNRCLDHVSYQSISFSIIFISLYLARL